jgi:anti-sigma28 factor (negative regulator of flagellin synthesis)
MDINKISRFLFSQPSLSGAAGSVSNQTEQLPSIPTKPQNSDAVTLSQSFGAEESAENRQAKVDDIKKRVASGSYKQPDSETLARAFAQDVLA